MGRSWASQKNCRFYKFFIGYSTNLQIKSLKSTPTENCAYNVQMNEFQVTELHVQCDLESNCFNGLERSVTLNLV